MQIFSNISKIRAIIQEQKRNGRTIGLVPTMGALHEGHISLIRRSVQKNDATVVSIFVNPLQFGENEDLAKYPRTLESDFEAAKNAGVDFVFNPTAEEVLGTEMLSYVDIDKLQDNLCGRSRPGHFRGVCTIVAKLFNIISPDRAYFGQKDIQQFIILKRMVQDLNFGVAMIRCPIVRENDGLAMSSRNQYLSNSEKKKATVLFRALTKGRELFQSGETSAEKIRAELVSLLEPESSRIDYVTIVDENMQDVGIVQPGDILAIAVYIGATRLIDNYIFENSAAKEDENV